MALNFVGKKGLKMARFFVTKDNIASGFITVTGDELIHISRVLRMKQGDTLTLCDGDKNDYECIISSISKSEAVCEIKAYAQNPCEQDFSVTLFQSVPKGEKTDYIIQKTVELGITEIRPFFSARTVAKSLGKVQRWNKIALEAAKQCGRGIVPKVYEPVSFSEALAGDDAELKIFAYEEERDTSLKTVLRENTDCKKISVYVGPEGGFEAYEACDAQKAGCRTVTLGKRILRAETAPVVLVSNIMYELNL